MLAATMIYRPGQTTARASSGCGTCARFGGEFVPGKVATQHDQPLLVALTRAFYWQQMIDDGVVGSGSEIAQREGLHHSTVNELLRLTLLEPAVIQSILAGQQPRCMSLLWFQRNPLPTEWMAQREVVARFDV